MSLSNPTSVVTEQKLSEFYQGILPYLGTHAVTLSQTLAASDTTVTFTSIPTTGNNLIDFFSSDGSNYTAIDTSVSGQITLTYVASSSARTIYCRIEGV